MNSFGNFVSLSLVLCIAALPANAQSTSNDSAVNASVPTPKGQFSYLPEQPNESSIPRLDAEVAMENDYCVYQNEIPFVKAVKWANPQVKAAMRKLGPGWRSTFAYGDWRKPYGLESEPKDTSSIDEKELRNRKVRNFMRVLCGEYRDYPEMLASKLKTIVEAQHYASNEEMTSVDTSANLFTQITYPAYRKMLSVMRSMHSYRQRKIEHENDGFNYATAGQSSSWGNYNRVENSVPPWTHCEMKFMFETYMVKDAPSVQGDEYESKFAEYRKTKCSEEDLAWMYNFRGHKNYKALWLESNGFIWNSLRGNREMSARTARGDSFAHEYYLRPFSNRYARSRMALGAYLFYPDSDHPFMSQAGDSGGGPILYITDRDQDQNGIADYRFFRDTQGDGDQGVGGSGNRVSDERAASEPDTMGHASGWDPSMYWQPDMGFMQAFGTFEERMARMNVALDRHTNWGPTSYYMLDATKPNASRVEFQAAYSPVVACSYDISASNSFASGDYPTTHEYESGKTKWMFIMRFPTKNYYDEKMLKEGKPFDWDKHYFNETSLSNDYYSERALDRFGVVPPSDVYANVYFVYGATSWGEDGSLDSKGIEALYEDIPTPAEE